MDVGIAAFAHVHGAEHAFANARERDPGADWIRDAAFVEVHRHGRIVVHGTVAGRYVDIDGEGDLIGRDTAVGTIVGAVVGFALGPPAFAVGIVAGGSVGGVVEASHIPRLDGPAFDAARKHVPEGSSAVIVFSSMERIRSMYETLLAAADTFVHYRLDPGAEAELESALAAAPAAAPPRPDVSRPAPGRGAGRAPEPAGRGERADGS